MINIGDLELADVLNVAIANLGCSESLVLVQDVLVAPLLKFTGDRDDTTGAVLEFTVSTRIETN